MPLVPKDPFRVVTDIVTPVQPDRLWPRASVTAPNSVRIFIAISDSHPSKETRGTDILRALRIREELKPGFSSLYSTCHRYR